MWYCLLHDVQPHARQARNVRRKSVRFGNETESRLVSIVKVGSLSSWAEQLVAFFNIMSLRGISATPINSDDQDTPNTPFQSNGRGGLPSRESRTEVNSTGSRAVPLQSNVPRTTIPVNGSKRMKEPGAMLSVS